MSWLSFAVANLRHNALSSMLSVILLALGTATIVLLLLAGEQFSRTLARDAQNVDLVLGAKGSPVQLILSSVYHADVPIGNIALEDAAAWLDDPRIAQAVPLALGDSYQGFRIVGTTHDYLKLYPAKLAEGRLWQGEMQVVIGAAVARTSGLSLNQRFSSAHGLVPGQHTHDEKPYRVVGILENSGGVVDRLILTALDSVWTLHDEPHHDQDHEHEHEHEHDVTDHDHTESAHEEDAAPHPPRDITAMLLRYATPLAAMTLPRQINSSSMIQAASPAFELSRLMQLAGLGLDGIRAFAMLLIATAGFGIFAALYAALKARAADLAMLRCLGATRQELCAALLLEGLILSLLGAVLGFALGHLATSLLGIWLQDTRGLSVSGLIWLSQETWLFLVLVGVGVVASAIPAWQAYRVDVIRNLQGLNA
ncbi:MAG: ABC transporter permease [Oceanococcus sp.]|nr:MAG: ABC transporter permease [Oceanococcus sp.]